jgi:hypothetical protein
MNPRHSINFKNSFVLFFFLLLFGCGGASPNSAGAPAPNPGPNPGPDPEPVPEKQIVYSGKTTPAVITSSNAKTLAGASFNRSDVAPDISDSAAPSSLSQKSQVARVSSKIARATRHKTLKARSKIQSAPDIREEISITLHGRISGTATVTGVVNTDGTGRQHVFYDQFDDGDGFILLNGAMTYEVQAYDPVLDIDTAATLTFSALTYKDPVSYFSISGIIDSEITVNENTILLTINTTVEDQDTLRQFKAENYSIKEVYDSLSHPSRYSRTLSGRLYDSTEGYVDVVTSTPLFFSSYLQPFPNAGGPVLLTGQDGAQIRITPLSTTRVRIEVDSEGDGTFEMAVVLLWPALTGGDDTPANAAPTANAGPDQNVIVREVVTLNGNGSSDADGDALTYAWSMISIPEGSNAALSDPGAVRPFFTADLPGTYMIRLIVNDGTVSSDADSVSVVATRTRPISNAGADQTVPSGTEVRLDGSGSRDPNGGTLRYQWTFVTRPIGSNASVSNASSVNPTFLADVEGTYEIDLIVDNGHDTSVSDRLVTRALKQISPLNYRVIDAEYSKQLDKIIMISSNPNQLHVYDPITHNDVPVTLPLLPTSVSVRPDGLFAAVGHDGWASYVDLSAGKLIKTVEVSADVKDIILAENGYLYAFPRVDQWVVIHSVNLATEIETLSTGTIRAWTLVKLHPNGRVIYGANNGLSPSDIEKYSIENGTAQVLYDSPYHGDHPMCGDLWISEDGLRIFTKCGRVFRSSDVRSEDMVYNGALSNVDFITHLTHSSTMNKVIVIPSSSWFDSNVQDTEIQFYDYQFLSFDKQIELPPFIAQGDTFDAHGRFVFVSSDGSRQFVVVQADATSGLLYDFGVVNYGGPDEPVRPIPIANAGGDQYVPIGSTVTLDGSASGDPGGSAITYSWSLVSRPNGSNATLSNVNAAKPTFVADIEGPYEINLIVNNGRTSSPADSVTASASNSPIRGLSYRVIDAEYSKQMDKIIMISSSPDRVHIYDPLTQKDTAVSLPLTPTSLSVGPDGVHAAVGHDAYVSYIDLSAGTLVKTIAVSAQVGDVVLAGNGYIYAFPKVDQWVTIHSVNISAGTETLDSIIYAGSMARLHPNGQAMYTASGNLQKFSVVNGPAAPFYGNAFTFGPGHCGNFWISDDGLRIFTRCGEVYRSSDVQAEDMTYNGSLSELQDVTHLSHSALMHKVVAIPQPLWWDTTGPQDTQIQIYDDTFLGFERSISLPTFNVNSHSYPGHGRFVFIKSDGSQYFVILQADAASGMLFDFGVITFQ